MSFAPIRPLDMFLCARKPKKNEGTEKKLHN